MPEPPQLSVNDKVLLHLSRFITDLTVEEYPPECTQAGIAIAVGISRTHVPRAVKGLIKDGLLSEATARVRGHERRMSVYVVSGEGIAAVDKLWKGLLEGWYLVASGSTTSHLHGFEIEQQVGKRRALAAISQMKDGVVRLDETRRAPIRDLREAPSLTEFHGREEELKTMDEFMDSDSAILVVLGNRGFGTTALVRKFVESQDEEDVLWVPLKMNARAEELESRLVEFGGKLRKNISSGKELMMIDNVLVVFDDYHSVSEEVVEFFSYLVANKGEAKVIITARQEMPAYNWFYHKEDVDAKTVTELRIKGLDENSARKLLGKEKIDNDAFHRVIMMTHGQPSILKMLRENDVKGLKESSVFTPEEIRYLLFLKDKLQAQ